MSRPFKERTRFIGEDGLWYYDCYECEMFFPEHKMGINTRDKFGIDRRCKLCKRERYERSDRKVLPRQQRPKKGEVVNRWVDSIDRTLGMRFMEYSDFEDSMSFLRIIGYDTEKDVHTQFLERVEKKHGVKLEPSKGRHTDKDPYPFKSPYKNK